MNKKKSILQSNVLYTIIAIIIGFLIGAILLVIAGISPAVAYGKLISSVFSKPKYMVYTLVYAAPIILTGLSVAFSFRTGVFNIGAEGQLSSLDNLSRAVNLGNRYGIPTMGVVAVGKDMERTDRFFKLATRIVAELGANLVKSYYCDNFEEVVAACPVPIVVAGGKKLPEKEALELAYKAIQGGAKGLDMGRNIFQSMHPTEMAKSIAKIVHEKYTDKEAFEYYTDLINR